MAKTAMAPLCKARVIASSSKSSNMACSPLTVSQGLGLCTHLGPDLLGQPQGSQWVKKSIHYLRPIKAPLTEGTEGRGWGLLPWS